MNKAKILSIGQVVLCILIILGWVCLAFIATSLPERRHAALVKRVDAKIEAMCEGGRQ